jgi:hypothetical protein
VKAVPELRQWISVVELALIFRMPEFVFERVWEFAPKRTIICLYQDRQIVMEMQKNRACGADINKKFLIATILFRDETKITKRFGMVLDDLLKFKNWVIENRCEQIAVESTGTYWIPIHAVLEGSVDLIVADAYKIKHTPGRKTDVIYSEWVAELCLNVMIEPQRSNS